MILFRADGNSRIGSGHIMRCLSIADAGRKYLKEEIIFVLASEEFKETIENRGYPCVVLGTDYRHMASETGKMEELLLGKSLSCLFVDSYYTDFHYLSTVRKVAERAGGRLVCLDDVLSFAYPCHVLINYNIYGPDKRDEYRDLYEKAGVPAPRYMLGTAYVPLRAEFQGLPPRTVKKKADSILISTGGADPEHIALNLAEYLVNKGSGDGWGRLKDFQFHFVIGAMNRDRDRIRELMAAGRNIILHVNVNNMGQLMSRADAAISAAGSTLYELCAVQVPAVTYILADNQILGAEGFERHGILKCAGDVRAAGKEKMAERLLSEAVKLAEDYEKRREICAGQRALVDGNGAERIIRELYAACR